MHTIYTGGGRWSRKGHCEGKLQLPASFQLQLSASAVSFSFQLQLSASASRREGGITLCASAHSRWTGRWEQVIHASAWKALRLRCRVAGSLSRFFPQLVQGISPFHPIIRPFIPFSFFLPCQAPFVLPSEPLPSHPNLSSLYVPYS